MKTIIKSALCLFLGIGTLLEPVIIRAADTNIDASQAFPPPLYIINLPERIKWTTSNTPDPSGKPEAPTPGIIASEMTIRTATLRYDKITFEDGTIQEKWWLNGYMINKHPHYSLPLVSELISKTSGKWLKDFDLTELAWIRHTAPQRWVEYQGRKCLYFEGMVSDPSSSTPHGEKSENAFLVKVAAWIDPQTKLPVAWNDGCETYNYQLVAI